MSADKLLLPRSSVKRIMKLNEEVKVVSNETVMTTAKATELFVGGLALKAHEIATSRGRKTIKMEDIITAIQNNPRQMEFLDTCFQNPK
mmetsp:Transcript_366/g.667  ORF Transcript_366/g.667 Transcript_366/m.667 type:complete len:89 (+) Transcript_366:35-301(+)